MGETYFLVIEGYNNNEGAYVVDVGCEPKPEPQSIQCGDHLEGSTVGMPHQFGNSGGDVIYEFVADDQTYTFNACSTTDYDSLLRIYDSNEILVDYNDDHGGSCPSGSPSLSSHLVADSLQMGETYFLVIEGYSNNEGAYVVDVGCTPKPEPQSIQCGDHLEGSTVGMPHQFGNSGGDVIYEFVADDQTYTFNACSTTDHDSLLRIYDSNEIL